MAKTLGKRASQRNEMAKVTRTAMIIGGTFAGGILLMMIFSFLF